MVIAARKRVDRTYEYLVRCTQNLPRKERKRILKGYLEDKAKRKRDRTPAPPAPAGGITLNQAERKYGIYANTLRGWTKEGPHDRPRLLPVLLKTRNCTYVDEKILADLVEKYKAFPGRGYRTAYKEPVSV